MTFRMVSNRLTMACLAALVLAMLVLAGAGNLGGQSVAGKIGSRASSMNTCGPIAQVPGGEAAVEAWALANLNAKLPMSYSGKVTVGRVPVTNDPIRVDVDATIKNPAKSVDIVCAQSRFSSRLDVRVKVSGKAGSSTHNGDARVTGNYTVALSPARVCVANLKLSDLNLHNVQNDVDDWVRKKLNQSGLMGPFCVP